LEAYLFIDFLAIAWSCLQNIRISIKKDDEVWIEQASIRSNAPLITHALGAGVGHS
jgi:hypothetical protein